MASGLPEAAICVQDIDVQCVLQFTLIHAAGCALHRHTSRVIHRLELSFSFFSDIAARSLARASHDDDRWRQVAPPGPRNVLRTGIDETRSRRCELPSTIQVTEWWRECEVDVRSGDRSGDSLNLAETSCPRTTRDASFEIGTHRVQRTPEKCVRNAFTNTGIQARERAISGARVVERTAASFTSRTADDA